MQTVLWLAPGGFEGGFEGGGGGGATDHLVTHNLFDGIIDQQNQLGISLAVQYGLVPSPFHAFA